MLRFHFFNYQYPSTKTLSLKEERTLLWDVLERSQIHLNKLRSTAQQLAQFFKRTCRNVLTNRGLGLFKRAVLCPTNSSPNSQGRLGGVKITKSSTAQQLAQFFKRTWWSVPTKGSFPLLKLRFYAPKNSSPNSQGRPGGVKKNRMFDPNKLWEQ